MTSTTAQLRSQLLEWTEMLPNIPSAEEISEEILRICQSSAEPIEPELMLHVEFGSLIVYHLHRYHKLQDPSFTYGQDCNMCAQVGNEYSAKVTRVLLKPLTDEEQDVLYDAVAKIASKPEFFDLGEEIVRLTGEHYAKTNFSTV